MSAALRLVGATTDADPLTDLQPADRAQVHLRAAWTVLGRAVHELRAAGGFSNEIRLALLARDQVTAAGQEIARKQTRRDFPP